MLRGPATAGASPRMRGTGPDRPAARCARRCIPAHAGNGRRQRVPSAGSTVHPRACGERVREGNSLNRASGASPRMRGTAQVALGVRSSIRCIPAHAGNGPNNSSWTGKVHGASPRMRGTGNRPGWRTVTLRCIPAHAGNGPAGRRSRRRSPVHPRACGERAVAVVVGALEFGASPRMRGTAPAQLRGQRLLRCIPAHAGNGLRRSLGGPATAVHPRACGERATTIVQPVVDLGASPRMRGTDSVEWVIQAPCRCIPAHAGNGLLGRCASRR